MPRRNTPGRYPAYCPKPDCQAQRTSVYRPSQKLDPAEKARRAAARAAEREAVRKEREETRAREKALSAAARVRAREERAEAERRAHARAAMERVHAVQWRRTVKHIQKVKRGWGRELAKRRRAEEREREKAEAARQRKVKRELEVRRREEVREREKQRKAHEREQERRRVQFEKTQAKKAAEIRRRRGREALDPLWQDDTAMLLLPAILQAVRAAQQLEPDEAGRAALKRAVVKLAHAQGLSDTYAAVVAVAAEALSWAARLPSPGTAGPPESFDEIPARIRDAEVNGGQYKQDWEALAAA